MSNIHEEEVKVEKNTRPHEGYQYSHPSYGRISVSRINGKTELFGTDLQHSNFMRLTISTATCGQDLGRNWYNEEEVVTEVYMSCVQYAEMISSPNTTGVPCTLATTQEKGRIKYAPMTKLIDNIQEVAKETLEEAKQRNLKVKAEVTALFDKKSLNKADKKAILDLIEGLSSGITSSLPFYEEQFKKRVESTKLEARMEVESYLSHAVNSAGLEALKRPEVVRMLIEGEGGE